MNTRTPLDLHPSPDCKRVADLLPLLDDAETAGGTWGNALRTAREHAGACPYCQAQLRAYARLDTALRRSFGLEGRQAIAPRSTGEIMRYIEGRQTEGRQTEVRQTDDRDSRKPALPLLSPGAPNPRRHSTRALISGALAVASVVLIIGVSLLLFAGRLGGHGLGFAHSGPPRYTFPGTQGMLADISMVSPAEGWALGQVTKTPQGDRSLKEVAFYHYVNGAWTPVYVPTSQNFADGGVSGFNGTISMDSAADGWAVASNFNRFSVVLHYSDGAWNQVSAPFIVKLQALSPTSVWATAASDAGYGAGDIVHYDGSQWKAQTIAGLPSGSTPYIIDLHMSSTTEGWALLSGDSNAAPATYAVAHYTGGTWSIESSVTLSGFGDLTSLAMVSPTEGWILGELSVPDATGNTTHVPMKELLYHYVNGKWTDASLPLDRSVFTTFTAISMLSSSDGWIVGYEQNTYVGSTAANYERVPVLYHYNGSSWSSVTAPDTGTSVSAITGISFTSSGSAWGSGYASDIPGSDTIQDLDVLRRASPELFTYSGGAWQLYQP